MTKPAIRIVIDRIAERLGGIAGMGVFTDRPEDDPFDDADFPLANIRVPEVRQTIPDGQHATLHAGQLLIDLIGRNGSTVTADETNQANAVAIHSALMADWTLGGRLQDLEMVGLTTTEMEGADVGRAIFEWRVRFWTSNTNLGAIIGVGGTIFTD